MPESDPEYLWHYTNGGGLLSILNSGMLWATQIQYLNDVEELVHLVRGMVEMTITSNQYDVVDRDLAAVLEASVLQPDLFPICVTSFTTSGDDLSQWRGYSRHGDGYAIGFLATDIRKWVGAQPPSSNGVEWLLSRVYYAENFRDALAMSILNGAAKTRSETPSTTGDQFHLPEWFDENPFLTVDVRYALKQLMQIGALLKHGSFRAEDEWRISSPPLPPERFELRSTQTMLVPYVELPLETAAPVRKVVVGPGPHSGLTRDALSRRHPDIEVRTSQIPFRDW